jgi:hypothetical protein
LAERRLWEPEVAGSNPVVPTIPKKRPFGEIVEGLSLCEDKAYVVQTTVQTDRVEDLALDGIV